MVELTTISRLMMALDAGRIAEFSGRTLKDISVPGYFPPFIVLY